MTEQPSPDWEPQDAGPEESSVAPDSPRTGVGAVDQVLDDVDGLADAPLEEHFAVFERAHTTLRAALDDAPAGATDEQSGQPGQSA